QKSVIEERHVLPQKTMTIQYGVDTGKFYPIRGRTIRDELGISKEARVLGTVARFTEQKGHQYLIDAAPKIVSAFPDVYFVFVGDGPLRSELHFKVHQLGLDSQVLFLGFRSDVRDLLNAFDVFVLPSLYEGLPNVVLEAMACGKPVIATEVDGTPEAVVQGETGILVPTQDSEALANAIIELLGDRRKVEEMGRRGRERVEMKFSLDSEINKFVELYERL
ncbi:MAG: glycosyltransferase family 4 protein, partial [Candidatus Hodarchaeota archaeon]